MKKLAVLFFTMLVCTGIFGQNFAVIDDTYQNVNQAKARFHSQQTYQVKDNQVKAANQISNALEGREVSNLHLFVSTEPGSIVFSNMTINADNLKEYDRIGYCVQDQIGTTDRLALHGPISRLQAVDIAFDKPGHGLFLSYHPYHVTNFQHQFGFRIHELFAFAFEADDQAFGFGT